MKWFYLSVVAAMFLCNLGWSDEPRMTVLGNVSLPNRLQNGRFEEAKGGAFPYWHPWKDGYEVAGGQGRRRSAAAYCRSRGAGRDAQAGVWQTLQLDQSAPVPVLVQAWSRAANVTGRSDSHYSVYLDVFFSEGDPLYGQQASFETGTHGWQQRSVLVIPQRPISRINVYGLFRNHRGRVWFDDFEAHEMTGADVTAFDGVPVTTAPSRQDGEEGTTYRTEDGLVLGYDQQGGCVSTLRVDDVDLHAASIPSGFLVRDVAADSDFFGFPKGVCADLGLKLVAEFSEHPDHLAVSGTVSDTSGADRAITLVFALPVDAQGWAWHDDPRRERTIKPRLEYMNAVQMGTGATGLASLYPWACINDADSALALGLDMSSPAQYRIGYNAGTRQFFIAYDFGLSRETSNFPGSASFKFVIYRSEPGWGFRSAAKKFYSIFPEHFRCRSKKQGIWMPFTDVSTVQGWQDFGFRYHEGNNNVPFDDRAGILSFRYSEPSTWWMRMPKDVPRTEQGVLQHLQGLAGSRNPAIRRAAQAVEVSGSRDGKGRRQFLIRNTPWCDGAVFSLNPNPFIPGASEARMYWNEGVKRRLYGPGAGGVQDGEYLDSLEAYVTATENFNREHFRTTTLPLTFSKDSKKPVIHKIFSTYEFTRWLSQDLHGMKKLLFANAVPHRFGFLCASLDVMGTETNWLRSGTWSPPPDSWFLFKRAMCYQKPYLLLMNTRFDAFTPLLVEKYFQRSLFYGIYPSMFSHNASDDPYWKNPKWYNRDRHLFKRYIPLVKRVAEAGWEPVTYASSSNPKVYVERFGPRAEGDLYLTLLNASSERQEAVIHVSSQPLNVAEVTQVEDLVTGARLAASAAADGLEIPTELDPEQVRVLWLPGCTGPAPPGP